MAGMGKNMSKYDKMIEENQRKSKEKIELALQAIQDMLANKESFPRHVDHFEHPA